MGACYALRAIERGYISLIFINSSPAIPMWGGRTTFLGASPIAAGIPGGKHPPYVMDMAMTVIARGKIRLAAMKGDPIPQGLALDIDGNPTTDAAKAFEGGCLPFGGVKGSVLGMLMDLLSGVLTGANFGGDVKSLYFDHSEPQNVGHLFFAIKPDLFLSLTDFGARMDMFYERIKDLPRAAGVDEIMLPGEPEQRREAPPRRYPHHGQRHRRPDRRGRCGGCGLSGAARMTRLSAHIGYLYADLPLAGRLAAAARDGFTAVEHPGPYAIPAPGMRARLDDLGLAFTQITSGMGGAGEKGLACLPGREVEFRAGFDRALDYAVTVGARFLHPMEGVVSGAGWTRARPIAVIWAGRWSASRAQASACWSRRSPSPAITWPRCGRRPSCRTPSPAASIYCWTAITPPFWVSIRRSGPRPMPRASAMSISPTIPAGTSRAAAPSTLPPCARRCRVPATRASSALNTSPFPVQKALAFCATGT